MIHDDTTKKHMLIIFGPTGVGKSELAERIAQNIPAEIINMDMGQFYTPLTIGTAKPDWRNASVPHHLFDIVNVPEDFSVVAYRASLMNVLQQVWSRGNMPIVVGGSGFYLNSIFFPPKVPVAVPNTRVVTRETVLRAWQELHDIDPARAALIEKHDSYRVGRALDIWYTTGVKPSEYTVSFQAPSSFTLLFLTRERESLYKRINERVEVMMQQGWLNEVEGLCQTDWEHFLLKKKLIGYNELLHYMDGDKTEPDLKDAVAIIKQRTRHYAKRQHTFWRMLQQKIAYELAMQEGGGRDSSLELINLTLLNVDLYIKLLTQRLLTFVQ